MSWLDRSILRISLSTSVLVCACSHASDSSQTKTWYRDVEPIVSEHCASCHEPGGAGSVVLDFPVDDPAAYLQATPIFADAVSVLDSGFMPWWLADETCRHYDHERRLDEAQKQVFRDFLQGGSQRGDPEDAPPAFAPPPLARVDTALTPSEAYLPVTDPAMALSDTRCFVLDPALTAAKDVVGFAIRPGSPRVHRAAVFSMPAQAAQKLDEADAGPGYACFGGPMGAASLIGEYVPGVLPQTYPTGTGIRLDPGSRLVLQIRYDLQTGENVPDRTEVDLEYAEVPVPHPAHFEAITNDSFVIPPLASDFAATATFSVSTPLTLWGVAPHLLAYGRKAHMALTQTTGEACLIDVSSWDTSWEQSYFFSNPASISLVPGDSITLECTWDNPGESPVIPGSSATDEACIGYAYLSDD